VGGDDPVENAFPDQLQSYCPVLTGSIGREVTSHSGLRPEAILALCVRSPSPRALAGSHDQQAALMGRLWRLPSDATMGVLEAIGATHPAKAVAKAARKACFQHRSWAATA